MTDDEKAAADRAMLRVCWGIFDIDGNWRPNPWLRMTADEQRQQNIAAGLMTEDGKRIRLSLDK
jgi:hypothetical protein